MSLFRVIELFKGFNSWKHMFPEQEIPALLLHVLLLGHSFLFRSCSLMGVYSKSWNVKSPVAFVYLTLLHGDNIPWWSKFCW